MKCPIDNTDLVMADRQGVEIDYCPKCRGVWLDRGELDKIIERAAPSQLSALQPSHERSEDRDYDRRRDEPYKKKKKSLLGEIFDF